MHNAKKSNLVHGQKGVNHTVVFEFLSMRYTVDLLISLSKHVKQHASKKCIARLAKRLKHLLKVFGFSENALNACQN